MLQDTGERVIPEKMKNTNEVLLEHIARYHFAIEFVRGRVLDFASGSGYGSHIIAKKCKNKIDEVIGIDIDQEAVQYARSIYYHPLTTFLQGDVTEPNLSKQLGQFDTIVSFETIEHVEEEEQFLTNIFQMLKPGGTLILSTPFGKGRGVPCGSPFHVHQLTVDEFQTLFDPYPYKCIDFYYQKGVLIQPAQTNSKTNFPLGIAVCKK